MVKQTKDDDRQRRLWQAYLLLRSEEEEEYNQGFELLFWSCEALVMRFSRRSLRHHANRHPNRYPVLHDLAFHSENVSQLSWIIIYRKAGMFDCPDASEIEDRLNRWMSSIAAFVARQYLRGVQNWNQHNDPLEDQTTEAELDRVLTKGTRHDLDHVLERREAVALLWRAIGMLKPDEQELVVERLVFERSYREIAEMMRRSEQALRVMFNRVKTKLRRLVAELGREQGDADPNSE